ncbi:uncharacterized protein LOC133302677 [Gastrolobium bilobum]|uniref:uncharacterized protein LOC133302677 n=1 Tax=Gastrolobium bilobum TaxID=150636 RepID=UPI002AB04AB4|nr:uncharacterized protein LOC133302677 [Gastrolobium bilobum]
MVELYSLEEGNWRIIDASYLELLDLRIGDCREQLFFHENVHWVAYDSLQCNCILTFNMVEEKFEKMELPEEVATSPCKLVTSVIEGCLSIIEYLSSSICTIWSRRESWMKTYSVSSEVEFVQLMGLSTSEILIVRRHLYINLYSFDLHSEVMKNVGTLSVGKDLCAADFTQSLVLLDRGSNAASLLSGHDDEWEVQDFEEPLPFDKLNSIRWNEGHIKIYIGFVV